MRSTASRTDLFHLQTIQGTTGEKGEECISSHFRTREQGAFSVRYADSAGKGQIAENGAIELRRRCYKCLSHLQNALRHDLRTGENRGMVGMTRLELATSAVTASRFQVFSTT